MVNNSNENLLIDRTRLEVLDVFQLKRFQSWILAEVARLCL